jgi:hypothetical protein
MTCCNKSSCSITPQLCVDASIFVPENECTCYATAILFNQSTLVDEWDPQDEINQIPADALTPQTIKYTGDLTMCDDAIAKIDICASNSDDFTKICVSPPTITGINVAYSEANTCFLTNDPIGCYVSMFHGQGNFVLCPRDNPALCFDESEYIDHDYEYDIKFMGYKIGILYFTISQIELYPQVSWSITNVRVEDLVWYPGGGETTVAFNNDAVDVTCANQTPADCCNTHAENIGSACLVLSLKANNNVIGPFDGSKGHCLKRGVYKLCIAYKPWNAGCNSTWEIREIIEYVLTDEKLKAYWGCATSKKGQRICGCEDKATLYPGNLEIQSSGNPCNVFKNTNDFVLTICKVLQTFESIVGPSDSETSFVVTTIENATLPYSPTTLILNNQVVNSFSKMANGKLHVALKYECPYSYSKCPEPPTCLRDIKKRINKENCCVGTLSPFERTSGKCIETVFVSKELTDLQDHVFQNSNQSADVCVCLTPDCLCKVKCPSKKKHRRCSSSSSSSSSCSSEKHKKYRKHSKKHKKLCRKCEDPCDSHRSKRRCKKSSGKRYG